MLAGPTTKGPKQSAANNNAAYILVPDTSAPSESMPQRIRAVLTTKARGHNVMPDQCMSCDAAVP